jgi:homocysteine S-methyltransferase
LSRGTLLCDGAFGTYFDVRNPGIGYPVEWANVKEPELVRQIHLDYIDSGAAMIRTNTFGANAPSLQCDGESLRGIIKAGYGIAADAARARPDADVFVAASVGPVQRAGADAAAGEYLFVVRAFIDAGAGIFLFETMSDCDAALPALRHIKNTVKDSFVILSFCVNRYGYTDSGLSAKRIVRELPALEEVDCVGFNCGTGPLHLYKALSGLELHSSKFSIVLPNVGYPDIANNRFSYQQNVAYFTEWLAKIQALGVNIIGGCCGTTPQYTKAIRASMPMLGGAGARQADAPPDRRGTAKAGTAGAGAAGLSDAGTECSAREAGAEGKAAYAEGKVAGAQAAQPQAAQPQAAQPRAAQPQAEASPPFFDAILKARRKIIAVELDPPMNANYTKIMEDAIRLRNLGVDILTFADSPTGKMRADSFLIASKVFAETGVAVMPHICCRDKNEIAARSQILGAHINGIRSVLAVTGDPVPKSERSSARGVFNFDSVKLMRLINMMNEELFASEPVYFGGAINQSRPNIAAEADRLKRKIDAGAAWFMTQPAYGDEDAEIILSLKQKTGAVILCGLMPLISYRNALFVKNELPGIRVPDSVVAQYNPDMDRSAGEEVGIGIARGVVARTSAAIDGYYFILPFNRVHLVRPILE